MIKGYKMKKKRNLKLFLSTIIILYKSTACFSGENICTINSTTGDNPETKVTCNGNESITKLHLVDEKGNELKTVSAVIDFCTRLRQNQGPIPKTIKEKIIGSLADLQCVLETEACKLPANKNCSFSSRTANDGTSDLYINIKNGNFTNQIGPSKNIAEMIQYLPLLTNSTNPGSVAHCDVASFAKKECTLKTEEGKINLYYDGKVLQTYSVGSAATQDFNVLTKGAGTIGVLCKEKRPEEITKCYLGNPSSEANFKISIKADSGITEPDSNTCDDNQNVKKANDPLEKAIAQINCLASRKPAKCNMPGPQNCYFVPSENNRLVVKYRVEADTFMTFGPFETLDSAILQAPSIKKICDFESASLCWSEKERQGNFVLKMNNGIVLRADDEDTIKTKLKKLIEAGLCKESTPLSPTPKKPNDGSVKK